jgi:hypothetical protein
MESQKLDIVELIELNPITKLSKDYLKIIKVNFYKKFKKISQNHNKNYL